MRTDFQQVARTFSASGIIGATVQTVRLSLPCSRSLPNRRIYLGWVAVEDAAPDTVNQPEIAEASIDFRLSNNEVGELNYGGCSNDALLSTVNLGGFGIGRRLENGLPPFEIWGTPVTAARPTNLAPHSLVLPVRFASISASTPVHLVTVPTAVRVECDSIDLEARFYWDTGLATQFRLFFAHHSFA